MTQKYADLIDRVTVERQYLDDRTKKTRYARPGYNYIEAHTKADNLWAILYFNSIFYLNVSNAEWINWMLHGIKIV